MITFFMYGSYSSDALEEVSPDRTKQAVTLIHELDGKVQSMYAMLGDDDIVLIVDFPDVTIALKASVALTDLTGIMFSTTPAVAIEEFDAMMEDL